MLINKGVKRLRFNFSRVGGGEKLYKCLFRSQKWFEPIAFFFIVLSVKLLCIEHSFSDALLLPLSRPATGRDNRNTAAFCLLKKYAPHFFNPACGGTRQKEAAYPVTGKN